MVLTISFSNHLLLSLVKKKWAVVFRALDSVHLMKKHTETSQDHDTIKFLQ